MRVIDETGNTYGKWTVLRQAEGYEGRGAHWICKCECGLEKPVDGRCLRGGQSLGCRSCQYTEHGHNKRGKASSTYLSWKAMNVRCNNPYDKHYHNYGGRGITICERWHDFQNFLDDMGEKPAKGLTIERLDTNGDYTPENCLWATKGHQTRNKRNNVFLEYGGKRFVLNVWAKALGVDHKVITKRLNKDRSNFAEIVEEIKQRKDNKGITNQDT